MGLAILAATRSGALSASRLGTSSPMTSDRYVVTSTTSASAITSLYGASAGTRARPTDKSCATVVPPNAPARMPISVIAI